MELQCDLITAGASTLSLITSFFQATTNNNKAKREAPTSPKQFWQLDLLLLGHQRQATTLTLRGSVVVYHFPNASK